MSLTLIKRPLGHKLNYTDIAAEVIDDGQGYALVYTGTAHGLSDGDYVYIESDIDSYNGFKYVDSISYDSFKIKNSEGGDLIEFVQDADISYRVSVLNHGWQAVHLPIVYELQSDLWPNNVAGEAYLPNGVASFVNKNGYVQLNLDHALIGATKKNWIELVGDGPLAGPYQIISVPVGWQIVINLAYDASLDFSNLLVVDYYKNYSINVNVWAGLSGAHRWEAKKPYELAGTMKFVPDADGKAKFSVNEILKGYIKTRNELTLDTLPNNLDFHVSFYIEYFESYDDSDGTEVTTFDGETVVDSFEGHATNSAMPFKSLNSGFMSDYVNEDTFLARWLTLFDVPLAIVDRFFDISFINQYNGFDILITKNGVSYMTIENPGQGIIRVPFVPASNETQMCIIAYAIPVTPTLQDFQNRPGMDLTWALGSNPSVTVPNPGDTNMIYLDYPFEPGVNYTVTFNGTETGGNARFRITDDAYVTQFQDSPGGVGAIMGSINFTATVNTTKVVILHESSFGGTSMTVTSFSLSPEVDNIQITEQICINVISECENTYVNDNLRLTQGSQLRELE